MDNHPVGKVRGQAHLGQRFEIFASLDGGVGRSAAMRFDQQQNAAALAQLCGTPEDLKVLLKAENVTSRMAINKRDLAVRGELELRFQALDMIHIRLALRQDLTNEPQSMGGVEARNLGRRLVQGAQIDLGSLEAGLH